MVSQYAEGIELDLWNMDHWASPVEGGADKCHLNDVGEDTEQGEGCEILWVNGDYSYEREKVGMGLEVVAEVEDLVSSPKTSISDQQAHAARAKLTACQGKAAKCVEVVSTVAHGSLEDLPRETRRR